MQISDNFTQSHWVSRPGFLEVVTCTATALAYLGVLSFGFVYDDHVTIVRNAALRSWACVPDAFVSTSAALPFYRPVAVLWFRLNYALFGLNAAWWHMATLAGHVLVTYLVFLLAHKLLRDRSSAFVAGLLFGLYPLHTENVSWLSAANDLVMTAFLLGSFLAFLKYRAEHRRHWQAVSVGLFAASLLAKEPAAVFPALILAFVLFEAEQRERGWRTRIANALWQTVPYGAVLIAYVVARSLASGSVTPGKMVSVSWTTMMLSWPSVLWFDLRHLLLPIGSSEFYGVDYVRHAAFRSVGLPLLLLFALGVAAWVGMRKLSNPSMAWFACLWVVLPLFPTLYLRALTPGDFVHDRFLYLPSVGLVILLALIIRGLPWNFSFASSAAIQPAVVAGLAAAFAFGTLIYQMQWASDILLYQNGLRFVPNSSNLKDNLANALLSRGEFQRAIQLYREVLERDPSFWRSNYNLGYSYYRTGEYRQAEVYLNRAIQLDSSDPDQFIYLALVQLRVGRLLEATDNAERAIQRGPRSPGYHYALGIIWKDRGERARAAAEFEAELSAHPENSGARDQLQQLRALR